MCGIAGILSRSDVAGADGALVSMLRALRHRGPDDQGTFIDSLRGVHLGHARLSIIDLSERGRQPMKNEDGNVVISCNGEIYNYLPLMAELKRLGHTFSSDCDSEVAVHAYEEWGESSFSRLEGMFALAVWDSRSDLLYLVRDRVGIKPLLYLQTSKGFVFASEAKAFRCLPADWWTPSIDAEALDELMGFHYLFDRERTLFAGVKRVAPGAYLKVKRDSTPVSTDYWILRAEPAVERMSFDEAVVRCDDVLRNSVKEHLQADVPIGILLSGGLDSSTISALAAKVSSRPVHTFTAGFEHAWDERPYARRVADHIRSVHTEVFIDPAEVSGRMEEIIGYFDDMTSLDGGLFSVYLIAEKVKRLGIKVLLVGEGSDEVFAGYSWYGLSMKPFCWLPSRVHSYGFYYAVSRLLPGRDSNRVFGTLHGIMSGYGERDICRRLQRFDITRQLGSHFLMKEDHGTMAHSIEARVPYLDRAVVEFAYSLPRKYKYAGEWFRFGSGQEKLILRHVAVRYLPAEIAFRKKRGFMVPMPEVLKSNMAKVRDYVLAKGSIARERFTVREIERLLNFSNAMYSPLHKHKEFMIWKLFLIEVWKRKYAIPNSGATC